MQRIALPKAPPRPRSESRGAKLIHEHPTSRPDRRLDTGLRPHILLICGGPDSRKDSLTNLIRAAGCDCTNFDLANGQEFNMCDTYVYDGTFARVKAREFTAAFASPPCTPFSVLHERPGPGGPPPVTVEGPERYGKRNLDPAVAERTKASILICIRVANILKEFVELKLPFLFETAEFVEGHTSVMNLNEYRTLRALPGVNLTTGLQCPFGANAPKGTSWLHHLVSIDDMPTTCPHSMRLWFSSRDNSTKFARHPPSHGRVTYTRIPNTKQQLREWRPTQFVASALAAYPPLLNRYIVAKLRRAIGDLSQPQASTPGSSSAPYTLTPRPGPTDDDANNARRRFSERIRWDQRVRGAIPPTEREIGDELALGGLRDAAGTVKRLHMVSAFGRNLGRQLREMLDSNSQSHTAAGTEAMSWVNLTHKAIGSEDPDCRPPSEAIEAVKRLLAETTNMTSMEHDFAPTRLTKVDAILLEAWRRRASHPDDQPGPWLARGAPAGILNPIIDPGVFPICSKPASMEPDDLHCDEQQFTNYAGVEGDGIAEQEMTAHFEKGHVMAFDTFCEL